MTEQTEPSGYAIVGYLVGAVVFLGTWGVVSLMGGFNGFLIGWIPSLVLAAVVGAMWPIALIAAIVLGIVLSG